MRAPWNRSAPRRTRVVAVLAASVLLLVTGCASRGIATLCSMHTAAGGRGHVVVVVLENRGYSKIIGNPAAPFVNALAGRGYLLTNMHAETHPSQPNYLALFSGSRQGDRRDTCPQRFTAANLSSQLRSAGLSFTGYAEGLPAAGSKTCRTDLYTRFLTPWNDFSNVPASANQPFSAFPVDYARLPTVSFVVPDLEHNMHNGTIRQADTWLNRKLSGYAAWASAHDSLLVLTWDEDDHSQHNRIPTVIVGAHIPATEVGSSANHYSLLRMIEDRYALPHLGASAAAAPIPLPCAG